MHCITYQDKFFSDDGFSRQRMRLFAMQIPGKGGGGRGVWWCDTVLLGYPLHRIVASGCVCVCCSCLRRQGIYARKATMATRVRAEAMEARYRASRHELIATSFPYRIALHRTPTYNFSPHLMISFQAKTQSSSPSASSPSPFPSFHHSYLI